MAEFRFYDTKHYKQLFLQSSHNAKLFYSKQDIKGCLENVRYASDNLCRWLICKVCGTDQAKAKAILKGERDFLKVFEHPLPTFPYGKRLISYLYQGAEVYVKGFPVEDFCLYYNTLREENPLFEKFLVCYSFFSRLFERIEAIEQGKIDLDKEASYSEDQKLLDVLEHCKSVNQEAYDDALDYLKLMHNSIMEAKKVVKECQDEVHEQHLVDEQLPKLLDDQLEKIQSNFSSQYKNCLDEIENKHKQTANFNITLFGATTAGKSTLREIFTHGDGSTIGKGAQRTTKDVRSYEWNGLTITDVPGIGAYQGEDDEKLALAESTYADLIIFLVSSGQPTEEEAHWLVRLKRKDKPIICIINYKYAIADNDDAEIFLEDAEEILNSKDLDEVKCQFNKFVNNYLPNEQVSIRVVHLLSRYLADQKKYDSIRAQLIKASRFELLEKDIVKEVVSNGVLMRKKCYLSIVDQPIYNQMSAMIDFCVSTSSTYRMSYEKKLDFDKWKQPFEIRSLNEIKEIVEERINAIKSSIPLFLDDHIEDSRSEFQRSWKEHVSSYKLDGLIKTKTESLQKEALDQVANYFETLSKELEISCRLDTTCGGEKIYNLKRFAEVATGILTAVLSGGWSILAFAVGSFFSWLFDSREEKLIREKQKKRNQLEKELAKSKERILDNIDNWHDKVIVRNIIKKTNGRFYAMKTCLKGLLDGQRTLIRSYRVCHQELSKKMILNTLANEKNNKIAHDSIEVYRIPSKITMIIPINVTINNSVLNIISNKLGNNEKVIAVTLNRELPMKSQINYLFKQFGIITPYKYQDKDRILYINSYDVFTQCKDEMDLIQQALNLIVLYVPKN